MLKRLQQLAEAQEKKREAAEKLRNRTVSHPAKQPARLPQKVKRALEPAPAPPPAREPKAGRANVPIFRDDEEVPGQLSHGLKELADAYLHVAEHRTRQILVAWPSCPSTVTLVHALAVLERWQDGDKHGVRGMVYPAKSNALQPLNHLHVGRAAILSHATRLLEVQPNPAVTRPLPQKDAYLYALNSLRPDAREQYNPSLGELLPSFHAGPGFTEWESCAAKLLSHIGAKLTRRAHSKALKTNCAVIGAPGSAPDALFTVDGRMTDTELRSALTQLKKLGAPEVVVVLATRAVRGTGSSWKTHLAKFCLMLEREFANTSPGLLVLTDEPSAAFSLKDEVAAQRLKRDGTSKASSPHDYAISGVPFTAMLDGLLAPGAVDHRSPEPREFDVSIVDAEAAKLVRKLLRITNELPGGRAAARPLMETVSFLGRLAALPCGVRDLTDYLSGSEISSRTRESFDWPGHMAAVNAYERDVGVGEHRAELLQCLSKGSELFEKYNEGTPFGHRLAQLVAAAATDESNRMVVVFASPLHKLLAERFLSAYAQFPGDVRFQSFAPRVRLVVASQLDDELNDQDATFVFAGLNEECLRLVLVDDRIPDKTAILLTQRNGQFLRFSLRTIAERFPEFSGFRERVDSILPHLVSLPEDASVLTSADFVLPSFRIELNADVSNGPEGMDPDAWCIRLEDGSAQFRRESHKVYVYDPGSHVATERGFRPAEVGSLQPGDRLFVMSADLREMVEHVLREAGVPIQSDKTFEGSLRGYHQQVSQKLAERFPSKNRAEQVRALRAAMVVINPKLDAELPGEQAMRHWVDLGESPNTPFDKLKPQAPLKEPNFKAFAEALGFSSLETAYQWQRVILAVRNSRRLDGRHVSDIYAFMLLQPESAMVHSNIKRQTLQGLFDKARDSTVIVQTVGPVSAKEAA